MSECGSIRELALRIFRNAKQPFEVEVICADIQPAVWILPLAARAVGVDLDSVSLGVVEVKGLTDEVIRGPGHRQALLQRSSHETTQLFLARQEDGEVKQSSRMSRTFASTFQGFQAQQWSAARAKRGGPISVLSPRQAEALVKLSLTFEVENLQLDSPQRPLIHSGFNLPTTMKVHNPEGLLAERLAAQLLAGNPASDPASVVSRLLPVQPQDLRGARLAMRARTSRLNSARIDRALTEERSIVITWLNRGTLHLVRSDDYAWLHSLTAAAVISANSRRLQQEGVSDEAAKKGVAIIKRSLENEGPMSRHQIGDHLRAGRVRVEGQALVHLLLLASRRGLIVRGPMIGREQAFALTRDWLGETQPMERDAALAELAHRYLAGHGPATDRDLAYWSGLALRDARAGLKAIGSEIIERGDGLRSLKGRRSTSDPRPPPRLLGSFVRTLFSWTSRG